MGVSSCPVSEVRLKRVFNSWFSHQVSDQRAGEEAFLSAGDFVK